MYNEYGKTNPRRNAVLREARKRALDNERYEDYLVERLNSWPTTDGSRLGWRKTLLLTPEEYRDRFGIGYS